MTPVTATTTAGAGRRLGQIDFLKSIMITLMISFHLVYIGDTYPYAKQIVYTFHMPVFLLLSGYLMNVGKQPRDFLSMILWFAVPYAVMESGYTMMAAVLPIREHIDHLSATVFLDKLLLHPLGPYWYLHTLILAGLTYYGVFRLPRLNLLSRYVLIGLCYALFARLGLTALALPYYFLAGAVVRHSGQPFLSVFQPSWLAIVPFALLATVPANLHPDTAGGVLMVYFAVSACLAVYPYVRGRLRRLLLFLGQNTLPLFLFSPIFTILCKQLVPVFRFDPTALLFLAVSLVVCIAGSLAVGRLMDACHVSPYFFGKKTSIINYQI